MIVRRNAFIQSSVQAPRNWSVILRSRQNTVGSKVGTKGRGENASERSD